MLRHLQETDRPTEVQETAFSLDVLARYACNTWDEAVGNGGPPFDVVVIGAGMFGAYAAVKAYRRGAAAGLRVLVLEAGPFVLPEHVQNLPRVGMGIPGPTTVDPGVARERVWGLPWRSRTAFPGLAYALGGRSVYWGGWAPALTEADLAQWPRPVADFLRLTAPKVAEEIGSATTEDYIHGELEKELARRFAAMVGRIPGLEKVEPAPLAVQGQGPRSGLFSFDKYSSVPLLVDAVRESVAHDGGDARRRLFVVPRVHVTRLRTEGRLVTGIEAYADGRWRHLPLAPGAQVVIANGTIEATRLALESFPTERMGRNLMGHLRTNLTVRVRRSSFDSPKAVEAAASLIRGSTTEGRFHVQVTATGTDGTNSEADMWRMVPDLDLVERMGRAEPDWVCVTLRGIGEMVGHRGPGKPEDRSWIDLSPYERDEFGMRRAWVNLVHTPTEERLWSAMFQASLALARGLARDPQHDLEYLVDGRWSPQPPPEAKARDRLGTTHHEAGTLWMGPDPVSSVTDLDGRFHHVANAYVAGPALFPTCGSANPALTAFALAQRTVEAIVREATPAPEPDFVPLFDGSMRGWRMSGAGAFRLGRGVLETEGGPGLLWHERELGDFVLRVDYRQSSEHDNSGVHVRLPPPGDDPASAQARGYEAQIDERGVDPATGQTGDARRLTGAIYGLAPVQRRAANPVGEWNTLEIEARGDRIRVRLNGQVASELAEGGRSRRGHVALQCHHAGSRVQFRNVRVRTL